MEERLERRRSGENEQREGGVKKRGKEGRRCEGSVKKRNMQREGGRRKEE